MTIDKIKLLEEQIRKHNELYWNQNSPEISDSDYDILVNELLKLDPTNIVPYEFAEAIEAGKEVNHDVPMLSMNKAYDTETVVKWAENFKGNQFSISPKMDGTACKIIYKDGRLHIASTRGNGKIGENVTTAVKLIRNVPKIIKCKDEIEIRGEICINLSDFSKLEGDQSNARNLAAGVLKRKNPNDTKHEKVPLTFYAYNVIGTDLKTEFEKFNFIREQGFQHVLIYSVTKDKISSTLEKFLSGEDNTWNRDKWDYLADGFIITASDVSEQESLGSTRHHPRYAIALKFQAETGETTLKDIEWSVSRTGVITPVGLVEPIVLSGASIERVSIHHAGFVVSKKLGKNAKVKMSRRGDVIPQIEHVIVPGTEDFEEPKTCPICGSPSERRKDFLYCTGNNCPAQIAGQIEHFVKVLEIDGLGSKIIDQICRSGVKTPAHLFHMTTGGLIRNVERMGKKNAQKIIDNINEKRNIPLNVFLRSLGINELGNHVSEEIAKVCKTVPDVMTMKKSDILALPKVGETIADSVYDGLRANDFLIRQLLKHITIVEPDKKAVGRFSGQSFVFTGTLIRMKRTEAQKAARELGGTTPSSVKKDLTYLVVGGRDRTSSKCVKAQKYIDEGSDIKIISEMDFVNMVNDN